ncbi:UNVERIFIED_CONTAM: hypothetical protein FKN15_001243 [Acipenser sinensis]
MENVLDYSISSDDDSFAFSPEPRNPQPIQPAPSVPDLPTPRQLRSMHPPCRRRYDDSTDHRFPAHPAFSHFRDIISPPDQETVKAAILHTLEATRSVSTSMKESAPILPVTSFIFAAIAPKPIPN